MDYLAIKGTNYRVECNWGAIVAFLAMKGTDSMAALANLGALAPSDMAMLMCCCINAGEKADGKDTTITPDFFYDMKPVEVMPIIGEFVRIYVEQSSPQVPDDPTEDSKKKE